MLLRVLVAATQLPLAERLERLLRGDDRLMSATTVADLDAQQLRFGTDFVVLAGSTLPELEAAIASIRGLEEAPEFVVVTEESSSEDAAAVLGAGGLGVLEASLEGEELRTAIEALVVRVRTTRETMARLGLAAGPTDALVVESPAMRALVDVAERVARASSTVLISGETGAGKERIAELVHAHSARAAGPFVALNCAAIPAELVESELFGHERGAFTGAYRSRRGYFELAHGGTLFLDEIAELPPRAQAKLLRVLQDRQLRPVGSDRLIPLDVRVIAATNRILEQEVEAGRFRADLFYRLGVVELEVPPLRERPEDLERLLDTELARLGASLGRSLEGYEAGARRALRDYAWPGNVRELINVVERAVLLCRGPLITLDDLPRSVTAAHGGAASGSGSLGPAAGLHLPDAWLELPWQELRERLLGEGEEAYLRHLLTQTGGRVGESARRAGLAERSLFEKMRRHGLRKEDFR